MTPEEIATFIEERAAVETSIENEPDHNGPRGIGRYLRALASELRDRFNARSHQIASTDIPNAPTDADYDRAQWQHWKKQFEEVSAESEGRRQQLVRLACEKTLEWKRADDAERCIKRIRSYACDGGHSFKDCFEAAAIRQAQGDPPFPRSEWCYRCAAIADFDDARAGVEAARQSLAEVQERNGTSLIQASSKSDDNLDTHKSCYCDDAELQRSCPLHGDR